MRSAAMWPVALSFGAVMGWAVRDHAELNRLDLKIKTAILERNKAETAYYQMARARDEKEMQPINGYYNGGKK